MFQWRRWDAFLDWTWGEAHTASDACAGCCCGAPERCPDCGGRLHRDPLELDLGEGIENTHSEFCENRDTANGRQVRAAP